MITVIGSLNHDLVTFTSVFPDAGETVQGDFFEEHLGGKGMNECVAAASLSKSGDQSVRMWGQLGSDRPAKLFLDRLAGLNVDTSLIEQVKGTSTGCATIVVQDGENRIIIIGGANSLFSPTAEQLQHVFPTDDPTHWVILQNEFPNPEFIIEWLKANVPSVKIVYNPSPLREHFDYSKVDYLVVNETEARKSFWKGHGELQDDSDLAQLVVRARAQLSGTLIVTLGSRGCIYNLPNETGFVEIPAHEVSGKIVDTTGAGDTFLGGFVAHRSGGASIEQSLKFAGAASSLAIQKKGASESIPTYAQVITI